MVAFKYLKTPILLFIISLFLNACNASPGGGSNSSLCASSAYPPSTTVPTQILESSQVWDFYSAPLLKPMKVSISNFNESMLASGLIFNAPFAQSDSATYGQSGALIMDNDGNPVWFRPLSSPNLMNTDFKVQQLFGMPVLTFWQGTIATPPAYTNIPPGSPEPGACFYILNQNYQIVKTVSAYYDFIPNLHEFIITPDNTALFLASKTVPFDLSQYGGPKDGAIYDYSIEEIDLTNNKLVYFWDALGHIPLESSHIPAYNATQSNNVWDVFHLNSLGLNSDNPDTILISSRSTWTIYLLDKTSGEFKWKLAGDNSGDFKIIESSAFFAWQHNANIISGNKINLYDDNCCNTHGVVPTGTPPSHGLILTLDFQNMIANFESSYYHNPNLS